MVMVADHPLWTLCLYGSSPGPQTVLLGLSQQISSTW